MQPYIPFSQEEQHHCVHQRRHSQLNISTEEEKIITAPTSSDKMPEPGDLIEFDRGLYQHWAVYVGDGFIVHVATQPGAIGSAASSSSSMPFPGSKAVVKMEKLHEVVPNRSYEIHNFLDDIYIPRSPEAIVKEAMSLVGQEWPYHLLDRNCEHFVTKMRYGISRSGQAWQGLRALRYGSTAFGSAVGAGTTPTGVGSGVGYLAARTLEILKR